MSGVRTPAAPKMAIFIDAPFKAFFTDLGRKRPVYFIAFLAGRMPDRSKSPGWALFNAATLWVARVRYVNASPVNDVESTHNKTGR
jgi:hypothetical protein